MTTKFALRFHPQQWIDDHAVDVDGDFTFEVTDKYEALKSSGALDADPTMSNSHWQTTFEAWYLRAVASGQIPQRWDGPFRLSVVDLEPGVQITYPQATGARIAKTTYTFTVLHLADAIPEDLRAALDEAWDGHAVGLEGDARTVLVPDEQVEDELVALGNDGRFFDFELGLDAQG